MFRRKKFLLVSLWLFITVSHASVTSSGELIKGGGISSKVVQKKEWLSFGKTYGSLSRKYNNKRFIYATSKTNGSGLFQSFKTEIGKNYNVSAILIGADSNRDEVFSTASFLTVSSVKPHPDGYDILATSQKVKGNTETLVQFTFQAKSTISYLAIRSTEAWKYANARNISVKETSITSTPVIEDTSVPEVNDDNYNDDTEGLVSNGTVRIVGSSKRYSKIQDALNHAKSGNIIEVSNGTYYEELTVSTNNLTLRAANGAKKVVISGAKLLNSWKYDNNRGLYVAASPCQNVKNLFINGKEKKASRYPKKGFYDIANSKDKKTNFTLKNFNVNQNFIQDSLAHLRTSQWRIYASRVNNVSSGNNIQLRDAHDIEYGLKRYDKVFFTQVLGAISNNGEWAWNNNKIYLKSVSSPKNVTVACSQYGIGLTPKARKVKISGLKITQIKGNGIVFTNNERSNRRNCSSQDNYLIENNSISYVSGWGINMSNNCENKGKTRILNNEVHHALSGGIRMSQVNNLLVSNNHIHDIATTHYNDDVLAHGEYGMGSGILLQSSAGGKIVKNRLERIAYAGIAMINYENYGGNRLIENNHITDAMLGLNDGGGIYAHIGGKEERNIRERDIIRNNIIKNCPGSFVGSPDKGSHSHYKQGVGIYLDDFSSQVDILNNTIIGSATSIYLHDAKNIKLEKNLLIESLHRGFYLESSNTRTTSHISFRENTLVGGIKTNKKPVTEVYSVRYKNGYNYLDASNSNIIRGRGKKVFQLRIASRKPKGMTYNQWVSNTGFDSDSRMVVSGSKAVVLTNPSTHSRGYSNLQGCRKANNSPLNRSSLDVAPYQSVVLFDCTHYKANTYYKSR